MKIAVPVEDGAASSIGATSGPGKRRLRSNTQTRRGGRHRAGNGGPPSSGMSMLSLSAMRAADAFTESRARWA